MWQHFSFRCVIVTGGCIQCLAKYSIQNDRKVISPDLVFKISRHYDHMTATKWSRGTCTLYVHRLFANSLMIATDVSFISSFLQALQ